MLKYIICSFTSQKCETGCILFLKAKEGSSTCSVFTVQKDATRIHLLFIICFLFLHSSFQSQAIENGINIPPSQCVLTASTTPMTHQHTLQKGWSLLPSQDKPFHTKLHLTRARDEHRTDLVPKSCFTNFNCTLQLAAVSHYHQTTGMKESSQGNFIYGPKNLELCLTQPFISSLLLQHKGNFKIHDFQILTFTVHPLSDHHTIVILWGFQCQVKTWAFLWLLWKI